MLRVDIPREAKLIGYADDLATVVIDDNEKSLVQKCNVVMARADKWMMTNGSELAPQKRRL